MTCWIRDMQFLIIYVVISTSFPGRGLSQCRVCFKVVNSVERDATAVKSMHCIDSQQSVTASVCANSAKS